MMYVLFITRYCHFFKVSVVCKKLENNVYLTSVKNLTITFLYIHACFIDNLFIALVNKIKPEKLIKAYFLTP